MEASHFLQNGTIPQEGARPGCNWMKVCTLAALLLSALLVVPLLVVCFLCLPRQPPDICWAHATWPSKKGDFIAWQWALTSCSGFVQNDTSQKLEILQSGMYFIYAQATRTRKVQSYFTITLYQDETLYNQMTGTNAEDGPASVHFGRPYFLRRGEKLHCRINEGLEHIQADNQTYWGLYKL